MVEDQEEYNSRDFASSRPAETWWKYCRDAENLVYITHEGYRRVQMMPELQAFFLEFSSDPKESEAALARAVSLAHRAEAEKSADFPNLHAHTLLGLWGALECLIQDLFIARLRQNEALFEHKLFAKIKLPLSSAYALDRAHRDAAILTAANRETASDLGVGVNKFERLLEPVELGGGCSSSS